MNELLNISHPPAFAYPPNSSIINCFINFNEHNKEFQWNIPKIQRELDTNHIEKLYQRFKNEYETSGIFNFGIFEVASLNDVLYLVNGQHRYNVLLKLYQDNHQDLLIHIRIKEVINESELNEHFRIVNDSKKSVICDNSNDQIIINGLKKYLIETYSNKYFPNTKNPHRPNIKLDSLVDKLIERDILNKLSITSPEDLIVKIDKLNDFYSKKSYSCEFWKNQQIKKDAKIWIEKARERNIRKPFFLGIYPDYEWLDRLILHHQKGIDYENMVHYWKNIHIRKKPNQKLKNLVWNKRNGDKTLNEGKCYVCEEQLSFKNMQCGHIISYYHGGKTELENLEPICGDCNRDMGINNLNEYKNLIRINI